MEEIGMCPICGYDTVGWCGCEQLVKQDENAPGTTPDHAEKIRHAKKLLAQRIADLIERDGEKFRQRLNKEKEYQRSLGFHKGD